MFLYLQFPCGYNWDRELEKWDNNYEKLSQNFLFCIFFRK